MQNLKEKRKLSSRIAYVNDLLPTRDTTLGSALPLSGPAFLISEQRVLVLFRMSFQL